MNNDVEFDYVSEMLAPVIDLHQTRPPGIDPGWLLWLLVNRKDKKKRKKVTASPDLLGLLRVLRILSSIGALTRLNLPPTVERPEFV